MAVLHDRAGTVRFLAQCLLSKLQYARLVSQQIVVRCKHPEQSAIVGKITSIMKPRSKDQHSVHD